MVLRLSLRRARPRASLPSEKPSQWSAQLLLAAAPEAWRRTTSQLAVSAHFRRQRERLGASGTCRRFSGLFRLGASRVRPSCRDFGPWNPIRPGQPVGAPARQWLPLQLSRSTRPTTANKMLTVMWDRCDGAPGGRGISDLHHHALQHAARLIVSDAWNPTGAGEFNSRTHLHGSVDGAELDTTMVGHDPQRSQLAPEPGVYTGASGGRCRRHLFGECHSREPIGAALLPDPRRMVIRSPR